MALTTYTNTNSDLTRTAVNAPARASSRQLLLMGLLIAGILASFVRVAELTRLNTLNISKEDPTGGVLIEEPASKTPLYYLSHGVQMVLLAAAGGLAFLTRSRRVPAGYDAWFVALVGASLLMSFRGMSLSDLLSSRLVGMTGPCVGVVSILVFVALKDPDFRMLGRLFDVMALVLTPLTIAAFARLNTPARQMVLATVGWYLDCLYWPAAWLLLKPARPGQWPIYLRGLPLVLYLIGAVATQTRLNILMAVLVVVAAVLVAARRGEGGGRMVGLVVGLLVIGAIGAVLLAGTRYEKLAKGSLLATQNRLTEDTRSNQLKSFFTTVAPAELVLGRGSRATWDWPGMSPRWAGGTDVGYLSLLLFGGLPLLISYVMFHFAPAWRVLKAKARGVELTCAAMVMLWAVRMFSSSFPELTPDYYPVLFCVGGCVRYLMDARAAAQA